MYRLSVILESSAKDSSPSAQNDTKQAAILGSLLLFATLLQIGVEKSVVIRYTIFVKVGVCAWRRKRNQ